MKKLNPIIIIASASNDVLRVPDFFDCWYVQSEK
jgi:hypothetical protein